MNSTRQSAQLYNLERKTIDDNTINTVLNSNIKVYEVERHIRNSKVKKSPEIHSDLNVETLQNCTFFKQRKS